MAHESAASGQRVQNLGAISSLLLGGTGALTALAIGDSNARIEEEAGRIEEARVRRRVARAQGRTLAAFGASGVVVNEGTPLDVLADEAREGEELALLARFGSQLRARGIRFDARDRAAKSVAGGIEGFVDIKSKQRTSLLSQEPSGNTSPLVQVAGES